MLPINLPPSPIQQCANASQTLCDMIKMSREAAQMAGPTPLLGTLERYKARTLVQLFLTYIIMYPIPTSFKILLVTM